MKEKKIISVDVEEKLVGTIIRIAEEEGLTISNIKEALGKVMVFMENNSIIEKRLP